LFYDKLPEICEIIIQILLKRRAGYILKKYTILFKNHEYLNIIKVGLNLLRLWKNLIIFAGTYFIDILCINNLYLSDEKNINHRGQWKSG